MKKFAVLAAAVGFALAASAGAEAQEKITLGYTTSDSLLAFVAKDKGLFAKEHLDVTLQRVAINANVISAMIAGSLQLGTPTAPDFLRAADSGLAVEAFSPASLISKKNTDTFGLVVRKDSGIKTAKDLVGRKVGNPGIGGVLDILFRRWLKDEGADPSSVVSAELAFPNLVDALKSGQLQASVTTEPFLSRMLTGGKTTMLADFSGELTQPSAAVVFATTKEWATAHSKELAGVRRALKEAADLVNSDPKVRLEAVAKYTRLPPAAVKSSLKITVGGGVLTEDQLSFWIKTMDEQKRLNNLHSAAGLIIR
jgi:NitT/TauT family transport system substrate-binding protein